MHFGPVISTHVLPTTNATRVFWSKMAEKGTLWVIPKSPPFGKGVCERRGLFWRPVRRAPAIGGGGGVGKGAPCPPPPPSDVYFPPNPSKS